MTRHEEEVISLLKRIEEEKTRIIKATHDINTFSFTMGYRAGIEKARELLSDNEIFREELKKYPDL